MKHAALASAILLALLAAAPAVAGPGSRAPEIDPALARAVAEMPLPSLPARLDDRTLVGGLLDRLLAGLRLEGGERSPVGTVVAENTRR